MSRLSDIPDSIFKDAVAQAYCLHDVVGILGFSSSSGSMGQWIKKRIEKMGLDTSHFDSSYRKTSHPKYKLSEILVENSNYQNIDRLKKRILKNNLLEYKCFECGNTGNWQGKPLSLQLEHKNGVHNDHRLENLCFLCPNCHSQTGTFAGRNKNSYALRAGMQTGEASGL